MTGDGTVTASIAAGVAHDAYGNPNLASTSTVKNGYADNIVEYLIPPDVGSVVVAEAGTVKNGILESNEPLKITWAASSHYGIASQTMTIDGRNVGPINGPYGGLYFSCPIGTMDAGSHTYTIQSTDLRGVHHQQDRHVQRGGVRPADDCQASWWPRPSSKNGVLDPNETLKITWDASSTAGSIASQTMTVDGRSHYADQRPLRRIVLLLPDRNLGGRLSLLHHPRDRFEGRQFGPLGHVRRCGRTRRLSPASWSPRPRGRNGILESNEPLKITWAASISTAMVSQTITVDGSAITPINGPYGGLYYSCTIGTWAAGNHTYTIPATDSRGVSSSKSGTFTVAAALTVGASAAPQGAAGMLSDAQLAPIAAAAIQRLESQLGSQVETAMAGVQIKVANLSPGMLGGDVGQDDLDRRQCRRLRLVRRSNPRRRRRVRRRARHPRLDRPTRARRQINMPIC